MQKGALIALILVVVILVSSGSYYIVSAKDKSLTANVVQGEVKKTADSGAAQGNNVDVKIIKIKASRFEYSPSTIIVNKGDHVQLIIENSDTAHGISIPDYNVQGLDSVEFVADKVGEFSFHCPTFCGPGHREMARTLIVQ